MIWSALVVTSGLRPRSIHSARLSLFGGSHKCIPYPSCHINDASNKGSRLLLAGVFIRIIVVRAVFVPTILRADAVGFTAKDRGSTS